MKDVKPLSCAVDRAAIAGEGGIVGAGTVVEFRDATEGAVNRAAVIGETAISSGPRCRRTHV